MAFSCIIIEWSLPLSYVYSSQLDHVGPSGLFLVMYCDVVPQHCPGWSWFSWFSWFARFPLQRPRGWRWNTGSSGWPWPWHAPWISLISRIPWHAPPGAFKVAGVAVVAVVAAGVAVVARLPRRGKFHVPQIFTTATSTSVSFCPTPWVQSVTCHVMTNTN